MQSMQVPNLKSNRMIQIYIISKNYLIDPLVCWQNFKGRPSLRVLMIVKFCDLCLSLLFCRMFWPFYCDSI